MIYLRWSSKVREVTESHWFTPNIFDSDQHCWLEWFGCQGIESTDRIAFKTMGGPESWCSNESVNLRTWHEFKMEVLSPHWPRNIPLPSNKVIADPTKSNQNHVLSCTYPISVQIHFNEKCWVRSLIIQMHECRKTIKKNIKRVQHLAG